MTMIHQIKTMTMNMNLLGEDMKAITHMMTSTINLMKISKSYQIIQSQTHKDIINRAMKKKILSMIKKKTLRKILRNIVIRMEVNLIQAQIFTKKVGNISTRKVNIKTRT